MAPQSVLSKVTITIQLTKQWPVFKPYLVLSLHFIIDLFLEEKLLLLGFSLVAPSYFTSYLSGYSLRFKKSCLKIFQIKSVKNNRHLCFHKLDLTNISIQSSLFWIFLDYLFFFHLSLKCLLKSSFIFFLSL